MVKNLRVINKSSHRIDKIVIHKLVNELQGLLKFEINSLLINFLSEEKIREINSKYLKHDYTTDIITFNYSEKIINLDAELYICPAVAKKNAKIFGETFKSEIHRLVIHGILHLLGFDDKQKRDRIVMKKEEDRIVEQINLILK